MEIKLDKQVRGTRLLMGFHAEQRKGILRNLEIDAKLCGFEEIVLPSIEPASLYVDKAGPEVLEQMYTFKDRKDRELCLRPEGTATCQLLAQTYLKSKRDVRLFYEARCWRYERPQAGRYREFTQFGVEILNPRKPAEARQELVSLATLMVKRFAKNYEVHTTVKRGLAYYVEDGFEITCPDLGAQKQVCGGGAYEQGVGFAFGVDRLMLLPDPN